MNPGLRLLLTIIITVVATVPVLFLGFWVEKTAMEKELATVSEKHLLLARNITAALDRYANDAKATIDVSDTPSGGTVFKISFPSHRSLKVVAV